MNETRYDVIIVGAGAAGLSAAIMLGRSKERVLTVSLPTRRNSTARSVRNVPFADGLAPAEIYAKMEVDAADAGVEFLWDAVEEVKATANEVIVRTRANGEYTATRLLLANGRRDEIPEWLPQGVWGKSVFECPYCHTFENAGKHFAVIGKGPNTIWMARLAQRHARRMTVIVGDADATAAEPRVTELLLADGAEVLTDQIGAATELLSGDLQLNTLEGREIIVGAALLAEVAQPDQRFPRALGLDLLDNGYVRTDLFGRTSHPRVYSAGNALGTSYYMWTGAASSGLNAARSIWEDVMTT